MEKLPSVKALLGAIIVILSLVVLRSHYQVLANLPIRSDVSILGSYLRASSKIPINLITKNNQMASEHIEVVESVLETPLAIEVVPTIVYEGMSMENLSAKLNRSLKSTLSGYGEMFAHLSIEYGVDPYVAVAIVLLETGCYSGTCSTLTSQCNNVGGMKGSPGCGGGAYKAFSSLEEGIEAFIKNLSKNYYRKGLTTVEQIGKKYAESNTWSTKVNNYINKIKAN
jgi:hypothetical protein